MDKPYFWENRRMDGWKDWRKCLVREGTTVSGLGLQELLLKVVGGIPRGVIVMNDE